MRFASRVFAGIVLVSAALSFLSSGAGAGAPPAKARPVTPRAPAPPRPLPPLPSLPSIARVKVTTHGAVLSVVEEVNLPRGDWRGEDLRFHVAFGAPGPRAIDAHLVAVGDGELEPSDDEAGDVLPVERVPRRPPTAHPLLGREAMAGIVVHLRAEALTRAFAQGNMAAVRIRSLIDATEPDASGALSLVVRLGTANGMPLTLGRLSFTSSAPSPPLTRVEARLCGADADPHPLAVGVSPKIPHVGDPAIAPVLAVRRVTDDLCVRIWQAPSKG